MDQYSARQAILMVGGAASVSCVDTDGLTIWKQGMSLGRHSMAQFVPLMGQGDTLLIEGDATALLPPSRVRAQPFGEGSHDSGANPDFKSKKMTPFEKQMRDQMAILTSRSQAVERRLVATQGAMDTKAKVVNQRIDDAKIAQEKEAEKQEQIEAEKEALIGSRTMEGTE